MPVRGVRPGRVRLAQVQLRGWIKNIIEDVTKDIIFSAKHIGIDVGGVARLPTRRTRWWLPRSPFVHRKAIDQFERLEHNRVLVFYGSEQIGADSTKIVHFLRFMEQTIIPAHAGARQDHAVHRGDGGRGAGRARRAQEHDHRGGHRGGAAGRRNAQRRRRMTGGGARAVLYS